MGCTSSAPNMNTSTAEKSIQFEEDMMNSGDVEQILYRASDSNETKVLPSCDNLKEPLHLDRNRSSTSLNIDKDNHEDYKLSESNNIGNFNNDDRTPKMKKLVDRVFVENLFNPETFKEQETKDPETETVEVKSEEIQEEPVENENVEHKEEKVDEIIEEHIEEETPKEIPEEAQSPTHSESSRATRWEALADIAAELPPSLMVDPITGQIYTVSK